MTPSRFVSHALVAAAIAVAPGKSVWGGELPNQKLDKVLQNAIANGCSGGPRRVIISVKSGYRKGMGDSLKAHGDKVTAEFKSIDAVAAEVHCDDLEALAAMSETTSVAIDGEVDTHAARRTSRSSKKTTTQTQA